LQPGGDPFHDQRRSGRIVNISSVVGQIGNMGQTNYAASKAAIMDSRKAWPGGRFKSITVNAVAPGFINTGMTAILPDKVKELFLQQIPLGKMGDREDVAEAFTGSVRGIQYVTGQVIHVNGGLYM